MSLEDFQLIDNEPIDNSIAERDFSKIYHQQGALMNNLDQNVEFIFGEKSNNHQVGNSYLEFDITVWRPTVGFNKKAETRLVNNGLAYCFKEATISTTGGVEIEQVKFIWQFSSIMRSLTSKDGELLTYFDKNTVDDDTNATMNNVSLNDRLIISHSVVVNRGKIKGQLPLEHIFGFCKTLKKITKNLGYHLIFKTADLQDIIFTTFAKDINVTVKNLHLYVPILILNSDTHVMFIGSIKNNYTITFDSWYTERKYSTDKNELQVDIGRAQHINSPDYLFVAFQTANRTGVPNKANNVAFFDNVNVRKYFCEIDCFRYPKDAILTNFPENDHLGQYTDLNLLYKEDVAEELMNPLINYTDVKNKYPIQVIDLRHPVDHITPKKIQLIEKFDTDAGNDYAQFLLC